MKPIQLFVASGLAAVMTFACVAPREPWDYSGYIREDPRSILVVPVINNSPEAGAEYFFLATITVPIAERGYYIFPVNTTQQLLAESGLAEPGLIRDSDPVALARLFGADAVLYVDVNDWQSNYMVLTTTVVVSFEYVLRSGKTGAVLWKNSQQMTYSPPTVNTGEPISTLLIMAATAAMVKAAPNYLPLARQANWGVVSNIVYGEGTPTQAMGNPLLYGPYHPLYGQDRSGSMRKQPEQKSSSSNRRSRKAR